MEQQTVSIIFFTVGALVAVGVYVAKNLEDRNYGPKYTRGSLDLFKDSERQLRSDSAGADRLLGSIVANDIAGETAYPADLEARAPHDRKAAKYLSVSLRRRTATFDTALLGSTHCLAAPTSAPAVAV